MDLWYDLIVPEFEFQAESSQELVDRIDALEKILLNERNHAAPKNQSSSPAAYSRTTPQNRKRQRPQVHNTSSHVTGQDRRPDQNKRQRPLSQNTEKNALFRSKTYTQCYLRSRMDTFLELLTICSKI